MNYILKSKMYIFPNKPIQLFPFCILHSVVGLVSFECRVGFYALRAACECTVSICLAF